MQPSRRAFLMGRRPPQTPWGLFRQRLALVAQERFQELPPSGAAPRALLRPSASADVRQARDLCAEYGVILALAGTADQIMDPVQPLLWIDPGQLDELTPQDGPQPTWRAQAGCTLGALAAAGLNQFALAPAQQTVAGWLAGRAVWSPGGGAVCGLLSAQLLFADGVSEELGAFGAADLRPLKSATVQRLVPALFQLAGGAAAVECRAQAAWPGRLRLDAMLPEPGASVNLAHLAAGHAGTLFWVESVVLAAMPPYAPVAAPAEPLPAVAQMQERMKALFDPRGLFPVLAL